jgi:hypothetical protein
MQNSAFYKRALAAGAVVLAITSGALHHAAAQTSAPQEFSARLLDGVGTQVPFASSASGPETVRASVNLLATFLYRRSGVMLDDATQTRLADMEARTLAGLSPRVSSSLLAKILATVAQGRAMSLSDQEIDYAVETMRGFYAPDLPAMFRDGRSAVQFRASVEGSLSPDSMAAGMRALRMNPAGSTLLPLLNQKIADQVTQRLALLGAALPEKFSSTAYGLTPVQAVLVGYAIAADDHLGDSDANLRRRMYSMQAGIQRLIGAPYPSPDGHFAFGANGYFFSTPLNLVFDKVTVNRFLDGIQR